MAHAGSRLPCGREEAQGSTAAVPAVRVLAPFSSDPKTGFRLGQVGAREFGGQHGSSPIVHPVELGDGAATHPRGVAAGGELAN